MTGRVKRFFPDRGFGFLVPDGGGEEPFFHVLSVAGHAELEAGQRVQYDTHETDRGLRAYNVAPLGEGGS